MLGCATYEIQQKIIRKPKKKEKKKNKNKTQKGVRKLTF
jgi:hypothetical protein